MTKTTLWRKHSGCVGFGGSCGRGTATIGLVIREAILEVVEATTMW